MLIAATHTHSAPAVMGIVSVPADKNYIAQLIDQIPKGIERAVRNLEPAPNRLAVIQDWGAHPHPSLDPRMPSWFDGKRRAGASWKTVVYALVGLSAIVSIWQFVEQPNRLPIDGPTPEPYLAPNVSHHRVGSGLNGDLEGKQVVSRL
jgi:hypothetical protein